MNIRCGITQREQFRVAGDIYPPTLIIDQLLFFDLLFSQNKKKYGEMYSHNFNIISLKDDSFFTFMQQTILEINSANM